MDLREARTAAVRRNWRDLQDDLKRALPRLLDDLDTIDREHAPAGIVPMEGELTEEQAAAPKEQLSIAVGGTVTTPPEYRAPTDAEIAAWIEAHPAEFETWLRKYDRIHGTQATKPAPRQAGRRTARTPRDT